MAAPCARARYRQVQTGGCLFLHFARGRKVPFQGALRTFFLPLPGLIRIQVNPTRCFQSLPADNRHVVFPACSGTLGTCRTWEEICCEHGKSVKISANLRQIEPLFTLKFPKICLRSAILSSRFPKSDRLPGFSIALHDAPRNEGHEDGIGQFRAVPCYTGYAGMGDMNCSRLKNRYVSRVAEGS